MPTRILIFIPIVLLFGCSPTEQENKNAQIDSLTILATGADSVRDLTKSISYYSEILKIDSTKLIALNNRGRAYVWFGELDKGFADYDKAVKLYPHEQTYYRRGMAYVQVNRYDKAMSDFKKSIELNSNFGEGYYGLALVTANQGKFDLALSLCSKADSLSYDFVTSRQIHITIYEKKGDFKALADEYTEAIKLNPSEPINYNNRGLAKIQLEQYNEAIADLDNAIKLDPKMAFAYNNKAFAQLKLKEFESAMVNVNTSLKLDDKNPFAFKNRAKIFIALNKKQEACNDLTIANNLSNDKILTAEVSELLNKTCKNNYH